MKSVSCSIQHLLFGVTEAVALWVESPVVVSVFLLTRGEVAMSFTVHVRHHFVLRLTDAKWVDHFFGTLQIFRAHSEGEGVFRADFVLWPLVVSRETLSERLSDVGGVLGFLDVVELVLHAQQLAALHHVNHML